MNGRIQDAVTGRFLSPDPFVTETVSTQGYNRYSYVMNNPLTLIDPSGFKGRTFMYNGSISNPFTQAFVSTSYVGSSASTGQWSTTDVKIDGVVVLHQNIWYSNGTAPGAGVGFTIAYRGGFVMRGGGGDRGGGGSDQSSGNTDGTTDEQAGNQPQEEQKPPCDPIAFGIFDASFTATEAAVGSAAANANLPPNMAETLTSKSVGAATMGRLAPGYVAQNIDWAKVAKGFSWASWGLAGYSVVSGFQGEPDSGNVRCDGSRCRAPAGERRLVWSRSVRCIRTQRRQQGACQRSEDDDGKMCSSVADTKVRDDGQDGFLHTNVPAGLRIHGDPLQEQISSFELRARCDFRWGLGGRARLHVGCGGMLRVARRDTSPAEYRHGFEARDVCRKPDDRARRSLVRGTQDTAFQIRKARLRG